MKRIARMFTEVLSNIIGPEKLLILEARIRFNKKLSFNNPITLSDKICYLEFRERDLKVGMCSDKYAVREYVKSKGLKEILIPLIGESYSSLNELDFELLPNEFVIKATHGSKMNLIVKSKNDLDWNAVIKMTESWISKKYIREFIEPHYAEVSKRLICEKYLESEETIVDYKIHCLNGKPEFILLCKGRNKGLELNLYDVDWMKIDAIKGKHKTFSTDAEPNNLKKMLEISKILSKDFKFVRVDLYEVNGQVYFGELTFTPAGGLVPYFTNEFDLLMGEKLVIDM